MNSAETPWSPGTMLAHRLGISKSGAIRRAMEMFLERSRGESVTFRMRGLVKSKLSLKELEEAYLVYKL